MKKILLVLVIFVSGMLLSSCGQTSTSQEKISNNIVTKTGTLTIKSGEEYLLKTSDGIVNMVSTKVNLDNYMKKKVTVTGMFSGSTLYVDEIKN